MQRKTLTILSSVTEAHLRRIVDWLKSDHSNIQALFVAYSTVINKGHLNIFVQKTKVFCESFYRKEQGKSKIVTEAVTSDNLRDNFRVLPRSLLVRTAVNWKQEFKGREISDKW